MSISLDSSVTVSFCERPDGCLCTSAHQAQGCNAGKRYPINLDTVRWQDAHSITPAAPETVLQEAQRLIYGERADAYGDAYDEAVKLSAGWSVIAGVEIPPEKCALMMVWLKTVRETNSHQRDNLVDGAGYFGLAEKVHQRLEREGVGG